MKNLKKFFHNKKIAYPSIIILLLLVVFLAKSFADPIENHVRVAENSDLTYYIDVVYDGKDANLVSSGGTTPCEIRSDYIFVEDKLPEGLTFKEFVTTEDGTIGAVDQADGSSCSGYVVGNSDGLTYNEESRTVSFKVRGLRAGCKLTVGVVTTTPTLGDKERIDFYNTAYARENAFSTKSNTVHAFIGREKATTYKVRYEYTGDVPNSAPPLPEDTEYASGATVGIEKEPNILGYAFSGWTSEDVEVMNDNFQMPEKEVVLRGAFTKSETYKVSYKINGEVPDDYIPPRDAFYAKDDEVGIESLKEGDIVNGYVFKGWTTTNNIDLSKETFKMPEEDVELVGNFERIQYMVSYDFQGAVHPTNKDASLPSPEQYKPQMLVTVAKNPANTTCTTEDDPTVRQCRFLGWYKNETFIMPEEDVVIYGEWQIINGTFAPTITKEIINPKDKYLKNEEVLFKIVVTNTADYEIHDVILQEKLEGAVFLEGEGYTLKNQEFVSIEKMNPHTSISISAKYVVKEDDPQEITNVVELVGALADNQNYLDTSKEYKATAEFKTENIGLNIHKINSKNQTLNGAEFSLCKDENCKEMVASGIQFKNLDVGTTYYLKETKNPIGYIPLNKTIKVEIDEEGNIAIEGYEVRYENGIATIDVINEPDETNPSNNPPSEENSSNSSINVPSTYDQIWSYVTLFVTSALALIGLGFYIYKNIKNEKK